MTKNTKNKLLTLMAALIMGITLMTTMQGHASQKDTAPIEDIKQGALLYDNWGKLSDTKPEGTHALYPLKAKKTGKSSWRCKECHGWDYVGKDGRYSKGSHFTGIKGVLDTASLSQEKILKTLTNSKGNHDFSKWLSKQQLESLSAFIKHGLIDYKGTIDKAADLSNGKNKYASNCASCHGADGNAIDFKSKKDGIQGIGLLSNDNPQESLHKIRWGHPGSDMPSIIADKALSAQDAADILGYSQTLK